VLDSRSQFIVLKNDSSNIAFACLFCDTASEQRAQNGASPQAKALVSMPPSSQAQARTTIGFFEKLNKTISLNALKLLSFQKLLNVICLVSIQVNQKCTSVSSIPEKSKELLTKFLDEHFPNETNETLNHLPRQKTAPMRHLSRAGSRKSSRDQENDLYKSLILKR